MIDSFVSRKDRIIASAVEIISESGLAALTTKNLAMKENMSEALLYKYFGGINEVLVEVVDRYLMFDKGIRKTIRAKEGSALEKLDDYMTAYATYYDNYYAMSTLMLHYEELLHNSDTREKIAWGITERLTFLEEIFKEAMEKKEIVDIISPAELANNFTGMLMAHILSRRIVYHKKTFKQELLDNLNSWIKLIKCK